MYCLYLQWQPCRERYYQGILKIKLISITKTKLKTFLDLQIIFFGCLHIELHRINWCSIQHPWQLWIHYFEFWHMHMMNAPPRIYNSLDFYVDLLDKCISSIYFAFLFVRILLVTSTIWSFSLITSPVCILTYEYEVCIIFHSVKKILIIQPNTSLIPHWPYFFANSNKLCAWKRLLCQKSFKEVILTGFCFTTFTLRVTSI